MAWSDNCRRAKNSRDPGRLACATQASTTAESLPSLCNATEDQIKVKPAVRSDDECHGPP
jgi:hypothetical protein